MLANDEASLSSPMNSGWNFNSLVQKQNIELPEDGVATKIKIKITGIKIAGFLTNSKTLLKLSFVRFSETSFSYCYFY